MEKQPNLYSIEHEGKGHAERKLEPLVSESPDEYENLRIAQQNLLGNKVLYEKFLQGLRDKENWDTQHLTFIANLFIKYCQNLSNSDIESLVQRFNVGVKKYASEQFGLPGKTSVDHESIQQKAMTASSIISVVDFIKARRQLFEVNPANKYDFYVEDGLDSKYKIDLIECIFSEDGDHINIDTMNLIQIKSSELREGEKEKILDSHRGWIHAAVMDFDSFKHEYTDGIPDGVTIETLAKNAEEVEMILIDICSDPSGFKPDDFIKRLDLEDLNNKQKAWLLSEYSSLIKHHVADIKSKGDIASEDADAIMGAIDAVEAKVRAKAKLPRNLAHIRNVNSIIAVGSKIVQETNLISAQDNKNIDKEKIIKYN